MPDPQPTVAYTQTALQRVIDAKFGILLDMSKHYQRAQIDCPDSPESEFLEQLVSPSIDGVKNLNLADLSVARSLLQSQLGSVNPLPIWAHVASGVLDLMAEGEWPSLTCMGLALRTERSETPIGIFLNRTGVHQIGDHTVSPPTGCRTFLDSFYRLTREIVTSESRFAEFKESLPGLLHYGIRLTNHAVEDHPSGSAGYYVNINLDDILQRFEEVGNGLRAAPAQHGNFVKYLVKTWLLGEEVVGVDTIATGSKQIALYREYLSTLTTGLLQQDLKFDTYLIPALAWIRNPQEFAVSANCYFAFTETLTENQALLLFSWTQSMLTGLAQFSSIHDINRQEQAREKARLEIENYKNMSLRRFVEKSIHHSNILSAISREMTSLIAPPSQALLSQHQRLVSLFAPQTMLKIGEQEVLQIAHEPSFYTKQTYKESSARLVLAVCFGRIFNIDETDQRNSTPEFYIALVSQTVLEYLNSIQEHEPLVKLAKILNWLISGQANGIEIYRLIVEQKNRDAAIEALTLLKKSVVSPLKLDDQKWPIQGVLLALLGNPTHFHSTFSFSKGGEVSDNLIGNIKKSIYYIGIRPGQSPLNCADTLVFLSEVASYAAEQGCRIIEVGVRASYDNNTLDHEICISFEKDFFRSISDGGFDPKEFGERMIPESELTARGDFTGMFQRLFSKIKVQAEWEVQKTATSEVNCIRTDSTERIRFSVLLSSRKLQLQWFSKRI